MVYLPAARNGNTVPSSYSDQDPVASYLFSRCPAVSVSRTFKISLARSVPSSQCFRLAPPPHIALLCSSRSLSVTLSCALSFAVWRPCLLISLSLLVFFPFSPPLAQIPFACSLACSLPPFLSHPPPPSGLCHTCKLFFFQLPSPSYFFSSLFM